MPRADRFPRPGVCRKPPVMRGPSAAPCPTGAGRRSRAVTGLPASARSSSAGRLTSWPTTGRPMPRWTPSPATRWARACCPRPASRLPVWVSRRSRPGLWARTWNGPSTAGCVRPTCAARIIFSICRHWACAPSSARASCCIWPSCSRKRNVSASSAAFLWPSRLSRRSGSRPRRT